MKTKQLHVIFFLLLLFGSISCEENDDLTSNLKQIDSEVGLYDFYLYDVSNNLTTKITSSPDKIELSHSISPDSKKLLYVDENGINEMNIDGSGNRILVAEGESPCYSPQGDKIAYINENRLYTINLDGTNNHRICDKDLGLWYPVWSRDGKNIVCSSGDGLCIISLDGELKIITSGSSADWYDWSHDSKEIFYSKFITNNFAQIFKYNILENKEYQITDTEKYNYNPKCNPSKELILFTSSHADYGSDLKICNQNGLNQTTVLHKAQITSPFWSPDGDKIVFVTEKANIAIVNKNGDGYRVINEIPSCCMEPKWSNDGNYILYYRAIFYI